MTKEIRRLVAEMCVGMFLYVLALGILAVIFRRGLAGMGFALGPVLAGLLAGFCADVAMLVHMAVVAERATDSRDEAYANRITLVQSVLRKIIFVVVLFFLGSRPQIDAVAMIIGALGLKMGAYLQPAVHRVAAAREASPETAQEAVAETAREAAAETTAEAGRRATLETAPEAPPASPDRTEPPRDGGDMTMGERRRKEYGNDEDSDDRE